MKKSFFFLTSVSMTLNMVVSAHDSSTQEAKVKMNYMFVANLGYIASFSAALATKEDPLFKTKIK